MDMDLDLDSQDQRRSHLENGEVEVDIPAAEYDHKASLFKEIHSSINGRSAHNLSTSVLRKKSDPMLVSTVRFRALRGMLSNVQEVILGTKLAILFPAIPLAIAADFYRFGRVSPQVSLN